MTKPVSLFVVALAAVFLALGQSSTGLADEPTVQVAIDVDESGNLNSVMGTTQADPTPTSFVTPTPTPLPTAVAPTVAPTAQYAVKFTQLAPDNGWIPIDVHLVSEAPGLGSWYFMIEIDGRQYSQMECRAAYGECTRLVPAAPQFVGSSSPGLVGDVVIGTIRIVPVRGLTQLTGLVVQFPFTDPLGRVVNHNLTVDPFVVVVPPSLGTPYIPPASLPRGGGQPPEASDARVRALILIGGVLATIGGFILARRRAPE